VNWYDWNEDKKGNSYKSRLQFDMDRVIQKAINWEHFLKIMEQYGYEIKFGKHIAFKQKNQQRFARAKTIGTNYTEEKIKDRIINKEKEIGNIIDIKNNIKAKTSRGYEHWVTKHNLQTATSTLVEIRNKGFNSMEELERDISRLSIEKNELKREFDKLSLEQKRIKEIVKHIQVCINKRGHYEGYRKKPNDKIYMMMNRKDVVLGKMRKDKDLSSDYWKFPRNTLTSSNCKTPMSMVEITIFMKSLDCTSVCDRRTERNAEGKQAKAPSKIVSIVRRNDLAFRVDMRSKYRECIRYFDRQLHRLDLVTITYL